MTDGQIKSHGLLIGAAVGVATLLAVVFWLRSSPDSAAHPSDSPPAKAFYSVDDGSSYFAASRQIPPFEHEGKPAVQAFVFEQGGKRSVGYLMRATAKAKQQAGDADKKSAERMLAMQPSNWEVKRPGDPAWVSMADPRAVQLMTPQPAGADVPILVDPE